MKYKIANSKNADTRTATSKTKKDLQIDTLKHIKDVQSVIGLLTIRLQEQAIRHDHTKIEYLDEFYQDWAEGTEGFADKDWYKRHITEERHHSNHYLHEDFNLLDLLEEVVDKVCAGKGRSGSVDMSFLQYDDELLQLALKNTVRLVDEMTKI